MKKPPVFKKKNKDLEHLEQVQVFEWAAFAMASGKYPQLRLMHAIPNGGKRDIRTATKIKNEGGLSGVPDIFLPVARGFYHGLYIEMKIAGGHLSDNQKDFIKGVKAEGFQVVTKWSHKEAIECLEDYLLGDMVKPGGSYA